MSDVAIRAEHLAKQYRIGHLQKRHDTLRDLIASKFRGAREERRLKRGFFGPPSSVSGPSDTIWALKDVSFEVKHGEVVGIIGRNGAGKSTLLKILSRITKPTQGYADIHGRVGSLLEVGTGFHSELTGRENIYLSGAILGMKKAEIDRKFDEIVAFAEVERFIDTPVKHYSSGMYVRLAFAVAAHLEPEILLVDEVLAVGDTAFQKKCLGKMDDVTKEGRTVLFVSHNLSAIRSLCRAVMTLEQGKTLGMGPADLQVSRHLSRLAEVSLTRLDMRSDREGNGRVRIVDLRFIDAQGQQIEDAISGRPLTILVGYKTDYPGSSPIVALSCYASSGERLFHVDNSIRGATLQPMFPSGEYACTFHKLPLPPGTYMINAMISIDGQIADHVHSAGRLKVVQGDYFGSGKATPNFGALVYVEHDWDTPTSLDQRSPIVSS